MVSVFDYLDFRKFLKDYFEEKKSLYSYFSYKYFAEKTGFNNKGFMYNIINGSKRLSTSNAFKLCSALRLNKKECEYFQNLVSFSQADSPAERDFFFKQMEGIKNQTGKPNAAKLVLKDQYELYSQWQHSVVRALIGMHPAQKKPAWFGRQLHPPISAREVRRSLELLLRLGLVRRNSDKTYSLCDRTISTGHEVQGIALFNFYLQHLGLASDALQKLPKNSRRFEGITLGISLKSYEKIGAEFESFVEKALVIAEQDKQADRVYQLMLQLYPLTKNALRGESQ
jgi:uncharacterized protein (TIGR02147 family)